MGRLVLGRVLGAPLHEGDDLTIAGEVARTGSLFLVQGEKTAKQAGADTVEIWGDGEARREFMYAPDLAGAILRALDDPNALPLVMNVGPGRDHSINDYYRIAAEVIGWQGRFIHDLDRPVGMRRKLLDVARQTAWGWAPQTPLRDGIAATYAHYLKDAR